MLLIDDLLLLPVRGFLGIFKKIHEMTQRELTDETALQEKLMELELRFELDEISEDEYNKQAAELTARLNALREERG
jgi:hypothetical protein